MISRDKMYHMAIVSSLSVMAITYVAFYPSRLHDAFYSCIMPRPQIGSQYAQRFLAAARGKNYLAATDKTYPAHECIFTVWEFSHVVYHSYIGYHFDFATSLWSGVSFELLEHYCASAGSYLDIVYNCIGYAIGSKIKRANLADRMKRKCGHLWGTIANRFYYR